MSWYAYKEWIETVIGLDMDALHVHAGIFIQIAAALVLRRSLASPWPWLVVLAVTLGNEWSDLTLEIWPNRSVQYAESIRDVWNTLLLPTVLMLLARIRPSLFHRGHNNGQANATA